MSADPLAVRIARRHQASILPRAVPTTTFRIELDWSGRISVIALKMALEPTTGYLVMLRFRPSLGSPTPPTVAWEGVTGNGELVTGTLVLRASVTEDTVASWAEITVDPTR
jgi:hypothetical protein